LALFAPQANAEPVAGLNTTYYTIDSVPPTRSNQIYTECGSEVENNINRSYDGEPYLNCTYDLFMVHMTGFITIPEHNTIEFWLASDDGGTINVDGNEWGNWWDQGCSATESGQIDIAAGSQSLDLWMYENGGGTCLMLAWNIDGAGWEIVPDSAFTTNDIPTDTTVPDTTIPDTTTTIQETTTTWASTTTFTTSTTTTSTIAPSTTVAVTPNLTTTTLQTIATYPPEPTMPEPPATVPLPQTTQPIETIPQETLNLPPEIVDTMPELVVTYPAVSSPQTLPFVDPTDTLPLPPDTLPDALQSDTSVPSPATTELPPDSQNNATEEVIKDPVTDEQFAEALSKIDDATKQEVQAIVEELLKGDLSTEQASELATSVTVLAAITGEEAQTIFNEIEPDQLTESDAALVAEALNDPSVPTEVKEAFEEVINIFGNNGFSDYVPVDSVVTVAVRRTIIAGTAILVAMPTPSARRKT